MTLKELVDVLSKPETKLDVYGPQGEKAYRGTKNSLLRYPTIMACPIKKMEVMSGELFIVLQNMPPATSSLLPIRKVTSRPKKNTSPCLP